MTGRYLSNCEPSVSRPFAALVLTLVVAASSAACDTEQPAKKRTLTRPGPEYAVPAVQDPLDLTLYTKRPCTIVTSTQVEQLHLPQGAEPDLAECEWKDDHVFWVKLRATVGLAKAYKNDTEAWVRDGKIESSWEPTTLAGYPAAHTRPDSGAAHICAIEVGVSDTQSFRIDDSGAGNRPAAVGSEDRQDPCARTRVAAEFVIQNLRDGAR